MDKGSQVEGLDCHLKCKECYATDQATPFGRMTWSHVTFSSGYVSTANLDGETNLKLKTAPSITQKALMNSSGDPKSIHLGVTIHDNPMRFTLFGLFVDDAEGHKGTHKGDEDVSVLLLAAH